MPDWKTLLSDAAEIVIEMPVPVNDWVLELAELLDETPCDVILDALQVGLPAVTERIKGATEPRSQLQPYTGPVETGDRAKFEAVKKIETKAHARLKAAQFEDDKPKNNT